MAENTFVDELYENTASTVRTATEAAMAPGAKIWDHLARRDPETGAPEGTLAIMIERMLRMVGLRTRKMISRPYRRRLQFA